MNDSFSITRRRALGAIATAAFTLATGRPGRAIAADGRSAAPKPTGWVPGLELYTLGLKPGDDIAAAFREVARIGYREVEFAVTYEKSAAELRRALDAAGLKSPAAHAVPRPSRGAWDLSGDIPKLAAEMKTLGVGYVVTPIPYLPDRIYDVLQHPPAGFDMPAVSRLFASLEPDDWKRTADFLNEKGAVLSKLGLKLAYHNHGAEFVPLSGDTNGLHLLVERTDPKLVHFELDIGWAASAGQQLQPLFDLLANRLALVHLKDVKRLAASVMDLASTDAGTGMVDWQEVVRLVRRSGSVRHMFVEQEEPFPKTPMESARVDYGFFTKLFTESEAAKEQA